MRVYNCIYTQTSLYSILYNFSLCSTTLGDFRAGLSRATIPIHSTLQSIQLYTTKCSTIYSISMRVYYCINTLKHHYTAYSTTTLYALQHLGTSELDPREPPFLYTINCKVYSYTLLQLYTYRLQSWTLESHHFSTIHCKVYSHTLLHNANLHLLHNTYRLQSQHCFTI